MVTAHSITAFCLVLVVAVHLLLPWISEYFREYIECSSACCCYIHDWEFVSFWVGWAFHQMPPHWWCFESTAEQSPKPLWMHVPSWAGRCLWGHCVESEAPGCTDSYSSGRCCQTITLTIPVTYLFVEQLSKFSHCLCASPPLIYLFYMCCYL